MNPWAESVMRAQSWWPLRPIYTGPRTCEHCKFWDGVPPIGLCRIHPPVESGTWPATSPTDWCGAFSPKPEPIKNLDLEPPQQPTGSEASIANETEVPGEAKE
jgi:hypothetical protein